VWFTSRREIMGTLVNRRLTTAVATLVAAMISALNVYLLGQTFFG
jgi:manganese transport protein